MIHSPAETADYGDELGNGVLGGHRILEYGRIHRAAMRAGEDPGRRDGPGRRPR